MKKAALLLAGIFCTLAATAQKKAEVTIGNGTSTRDVREIQDFNRLEVNGPFEVRLVSGKAGTITIEGEKNLTGLITTEVNGSVLTIASQQGRLFKSSKGNKIIIKVPFNTLQEVALRGSGTITVKKTITDDIKLSVEGSGHITADVSGKVVEALISGSGGIIVQGTAESFTVNVNGSGNITAKDLAYNSANIQVSGSGKAILQNNEIIRSSDGVVNIAPASAKNN